MVLNGVFVDFGVNLLTTFYGIVLSNSLHGSFFVSKKKDPEKKLAAFKHFWNTRISKSILEPLIRSFSWNSSGIGLVGIFVSLVLLEPIPFSE